MKRLEDKPFALLGVNSDSDRNGLKGVLAAEKITWRSFWNGGSTNGPISSAWNVQGWPSIWIIDHKGIIRARDKRGHDMDVEVDKLLKEMEDGK